MYQLNAIIPLDLSCEYEYIDGEYNQNVLDDQSESEDKLPLRYRQDGEFILGNEVDGILKEKKIELLSLLKADQDDLLVMRVSRKNHNGSSNNSRTRANAQTQLQLQTQTKLPSFSPVSTNATSDLYESEKIHVSF